MNDFEKTLSDRLAMLAQEAVPDAEAHVDDELAKVEWITPRRHARGNVTRALLVAAVVLLIVGSIAGIVAVRRDNDDTVRPAQSPSLSPSTVATTAVTATTTTAPKATGLEPPDAQAPAAGGCATAQNNIGDVALGSPDNVPNPRCLILYGNQKLRVANSASTPLTVSLGQHFHATIAAHGEYLFSDPVAQYLAPGVHFLAPTGLPAADVWVDPPCSQTAQGCATP